MNSMMGSRGPTGGNVGGTSTGKYSGDKLPSGYKAGQMGQFTPEQLQLFQSLFSHVGPESFLSKLAGGDQGSFEEMERPALRQFGALQGNLASRFSGMGMGARRSSGFQNAASGQASNFAQQLQSQRQGLQKQALEDLLGMSGQLLGQRPSERFLQEKEKSFWEKLLGAGIRGAGTAGGAYFGGPAGAQAGSQLGNTFASAFGI